MNIVVHARIKPECVAEYEARVKKIFAAAEQAQPRGVRYSSSRLSDGVTFLVQLELEDGVENPLPNVPGFTEYQEKLKEWYAEPPVLEQATLIGSYRSF